MKFIATAMRRNLPGKPDYEWVLRYANGAPVLFDDKEVAFKQAASFCNDSSHQLYCPAAQVHKELQ